MGTAWQSHYRSVPEPHRCALSFSRLGYCVSCAKLFLLTTGNNIRFKCNLFHLPTAPKNDNRHTISQRQMKLDFTALKRILLPKAQNTEKECYG